MSARALAWAWQQEPCIHIEKLVLVALADRCDEDGECYPSIHWLTCKCAPVSERTIKRALAALAEQGLLTKVERRRRSTGALGTWLYRLSLDQVPPMAPRDCLSLGATHGTADSTSKNTMSTDVLIAPARGHVQFFVDECRRVVGVDPLPNAKARMGKYCKELAAIGVAAETIRAAITEIVTAELGVGSFPGVVDQLHRKRARGANVASALERWKEKYG